MIAASNRTLGLPQLAARIGWGSVGLDHASPEQLFTESNFRSGMAWAAGLGTVFWTLVLAVIRLAA